MSVAAAAVPGVRVVLLQSGRRIVTRQRVAVPPAGCSGCGAGAPAEQCARCDARFCSLDCLAESVARAAAATHACDGCTEATAERMCAACTDARDRNPVRCVVCSASGCDACPGRGLWRAVCGEKGVCDLCVDSIAARAVDSPELCALLSSHMND